MRLGLSEDLHHPRQGGVGAGAHVQRLDGQPDGLEAAASSPVRSRGDGRTLTLGVGLVAESGGCPSHGHADARASTRTLITDSSSGL